jgi:hypothetical protein
MSNIDKILSKNKTKKKKSMSDYDRLVLVSSIKGLKSEIGWFYEQIVSKRKSALKKLDSVEKEITDRNEGKKKDRWFSLKDICKLLNWTFPENKEERKKLCNINNKIFIHGHDSHTLLYNFTVRALKEDSENPTDFLLPKTEQRMARKRRRREKKAGVKVVEKINLPKSDDEKKEARKERARIRKAAKEMGITTQEYKEKMAKGEVK